MTQGIIHLQTGEIIYKWFIYQCLSYPLYFYKKLFNEAIPDTDSIDYSVIHWF